MDFLDIKVVDQVLVELERPGPASGAGWETVTKVSTNARTGKEQIIFKAGSQWFWQDGTAKTPPLAFVATEKRTQKQ
jgi:hypothetical protein